MSDSVSELIYLIITYISVGLAIGEFGYCLFKIPSVEQKALSFISICNLFMNFGNWLVVRGSTSDICYAGLLFTYLGGAHLGFCFLLLISVIMHVKLNRKMCAVAILINIIWIIIAILDMRYNILYTELNYTIGKYVSLRNITYAPLFYVFMGWLFCYFLMILVIIGYNYKKHSVQFMIVQKSIVIFIISGLISYLGSLFSVVFKPEYDYTSISVSISLFLTILALYYFKPFALTHETDKEILNKLDDLLLAYDAEDRLIYNNSKASQILHFDVDAIYGINVHILGEQVEAILNLKDNDKITLGINSYQCNRLSVTTENSKPGTVIWLRDITKEEEYVQNVLSLKQAAEEANLAKSAFLAHISHEIRTPMNAVIGMDELILQESAEDTTKQYASNIKRAGKTLMSIINDVLDYSKIEAGKMEIVEAEYDLPEMIRDLCVFIRFRAEEKNLQFKVDVSPELPTLLLGDVLRIRQVITNILTNAVKYTETGYVLFSINYEPLSDNLINLIIKIKDTGIGIKEEDIPKLYGSFERIESNVNHKIEGTGLGMSITTQLLEIMNGTISVASEYAKGSEFTITIPQKIMSSDKIGIFNEETSLADDTDINTVLTHDVDILIVDDNEMNRIIAKKLIQNLLINVDEASSGKEALDIIKKKHFDIIILDHRMPEMTGVEVLERIHSDKDHMNIGVPVIIMTADVATDQKEMFKEKGFDDYIAKPIIIEQYIKTVLKYVPKNKIILKK